MKTEKNPPKAFRCWPKRVSGLEYLDEHLEERLDG
jgi:hypothetical protein